MLNSPAPSQDAALPDAVHVPQFLDSLALAPYIEIIKTTLPDMLRLRGKQNLLRHHPLLPQAPQHQARKPLLDRLHYPRRIGLCRFADQSMNVLGHHHRSHYHEIIALPHPFQNLDKAIAAPAAAQPGLAMITAAGNKMQMVSSVEPFKMAQHPGNLAM